MSLGSRRTRTAWDKKVVETEILALAYESAGVLDGNHPESKDFDQVRNLNDLFYSELIH